MGTTASVSSTASVSIRQPTDPYHKSGNRRSCFSPSAFLLSTSNHTTTMPTTSSILPKSYCQHNSMTVLMQLVLLQDWQRVLIRARLFGVEVTKTCALRLFQHTDKTFRVLPLHVACALDPPPQVVEALLQQQTIYTPTPNKQRHKGSLLPTTTKHSFLEQRDDDDDITEQRMVEHIPPLSLAAIPVEFVLRKKKKQSTNTTTTASRRSWKRQAKGRTDPKQGHQDDPRELLLIHHQQCSSSSSVEEYSAESVLEGRRLASNGSNSSNTNLYAYSVEAPTIHPSLIHDKDTFSPENSIGDDDDMDSLNDDSFYSTTLDNLSTCSDTITSPIFEDSVVEDDDDDDEDDDRHSTTATESSQLGSFLEQQGVVLQLTASGNIQPLPLPVNEKDPEHWTTIDPKPSGASSSITHTLSQQSSIFSSTRSSTDLNINLELSGFLESKDDEAGNHQDQLLAIHIACLYQASPIVLQLLLRAYPEGALTAIHGMLPIHLVAANWKLPPIPMELIPHVGRTPSGVSSSMIYSQLNDKDNSASKKGIDKKDRLQVLMEAFPETLLAKSVCHNLRPVEYVQHLLGSKNPESLGPNEETPLLFLEIREKDYRRKHAKVPSKRRTMDQKDSMDIDRTNSSSSNTSATMASISTDSSVSTGLTFVEMLQQGRWDIAMLCLESDHGLAKEWHYGIDKHNPITNEPCTLWKRLPLHIVCSSVACGDNKDGTVVPLGLIQLLIQVYPNGLRAVDPHTGMIPLHLACHSCGKQVQQSGSELLSPAESMTSVMLQVIRIALKAFPHSTKVVDVAGRLPLHHAIMVGAPFPVVELLVNQDPGSVLSPDQNGNTPLSYALKVYPPGDRVMSLLELAWL
ncbi:ankyrin repeat domain protein [Nitzschia inconspicua]|uniref:Ankyrin repeat domain protein n=1 Tax=Nitzschia inconspicua TaxID=303405 RepID=A0A9K3LXT6_9STRA|nr:ankyrin repeat domain protein [Nitzschia inconspicua]